ncbi:hypothetical protein D3C85_1586580 [compost metagenome]
MLTLTTALLLAMEEVHLSLGHGQDPRQLDAADTEFVGNSLQDGALIGLNPTIGEGGLQLDFQEEAQDIALTLTRLTKLGQGLPQREAALLALAE